MSRINLIFSKKVTRSIEKHKVSIKKHKELLNKLLKGLSKEENLQYGYDMGFIDEAEYLIMKSKGDDNGKKNED